MTEKRKNLIIITTGKSDRGGRAVVGFSLAASSVVLGIETAVFLTLEGTIWGMKGQADNVKISGFEPLSVYIQQFLDNNGKILVCSPCVEFFCTPPVPASDKRSMLINGAEYAGLTTIASIMENSSVATF